MPEPTKYDRQRKRVNPPHIGIKELRDLLGWTIDQLIDQIEVAPGQKPLTRGAISAIENGQRGVSQETLDAIASGYGLEPGTITTDYRPRITHRRRPAEDAA